MGSAALRISPAVGRLLRSRRKELGLTLRDVSEQIGRKGERFPASTLVRVEQGKLDPGVRRLHLLLRLYDLPAQLVDDLVELEAIAAEEPETRDLETLHREGIEHWRRGEIGQGLAHLFAIRVQNPRDGKSRAIRQKATLAFSIAARDLGKLNLAQRLVNDLLCEPSEPSLMARVLIQASTVWHALGSVEAALAFVRQAATHLGPGDHAQSAWVRHQEAKLLLQRCEPALAGRSIDKAITLYRREGDTEGEARALIVRIAILEAQATGDKAIACARKVVRMAERHGHKLVSVSARLELGRLLVKAGSANSAVEELRLAQAQAVLLEDRIAEFYAHYYLWKAHEVQEDRERGRFELRAAEHFVEFIDSSTPEAEEVRRHLR
jgi:transcriptional regulator with XRE-family HTH domain